MTKTDLIAQVAANTEMSKRALSRLSTPFLKHWARL